MLLQLGQAVAAAPTAAALRQSVPMGRVAGLFRDLRGIASATATRRTYGFLFEWLYPQHMPTMLKCLEVRGRAGVNWCACVCRQGRERVQGWSGGGRAAAGAQDGGSPTILKCHVVGNRSHLHYSLIQGLSLRVQRIRKVSCSTERCVQPTDLCPPSFYPFRALPASRPGPTPPR